MRFIVILVLALMLFIWIFAYWQVMRLRILIVMLNITGFMSKTPKILFNIWLKILTFYAKH